MTDADVLRGMTAPPTLDALEAGADALDALPRLRTSIVDLTTRLTATEAERNELRRRIAQLQFPALERPTGPGYSRYEDVYKTGMDFRQVLAATPAGTVLTLPEGVFEFADFADPRGWYEGVRLPTHCKGLWGSGRESILRMRARSSTKGSDTTAVPTKAWATNQTALLGVWTPGTVVKNLRLQGTDQGHAYNGLRIAGIATKPIADVTVEAVFLDGCAPGYAGFPPGETFGLSVNRANRVRLIRCEVDGRDPVTRERVGASPIGWNNATDAYCEDVHAHHSRYGTVTFWQTERIHTVRLRSEFNGGTGINHENVRGSVLHEQPTIIIDRAHAQNPAMHVSLLNGSYGDNPDVTLTDVVHDAGLNGGTFSVNMADGYKDPITGAGMSQKTLPKITKGGVTLEGRDTKAAGWNVGLDPAKHFVRYH